MNGALYVAWRTGDTTNGRWGPVGRLEHDAGGYRFVYTRGARTLEGFRAFPGMPHLDAVYESDELFPLFANRLLAKSRPEYEAFLAWGGFDPNSPPDPIAILSVTEGMRQTDSLEVFPSPMRDADGCYVGKFFLHGIRWFPKAAQERSGELQPGDTLGLMPDISNPYDPNAVAVRTCDLQDRYMIGYVPRYLARDVYGLAGGCGANYIRLHVERVNKDAPLQQRLLCRMSACWPDNFQPCGGEEFQPIARDVAPAQAQGGQMNEGDVELAALGWLQALGYELRHGPELAPGQPGAERADYGRVVLEDRLRQALQRLNPTLPPDAIDQAFRKLTRPDSPSLVGANHALHKYLVEGVPVEYQRPDGSIGGAAVAVLDYDDPGNNEFLAVNQFTVVENQRNRRADIVLFINGLPLAVIELKNAADQRADIWQAFNQLETYKQQIPALFTYNEALVISDGTLARIGTLTAGKEWFMPWRTVGGEALAPASLPELQVTLEGVFEKRRFLDLIRYFIVFEDAGGGVLVKKMAGYHQFHAVNLAVESTARAATETGNRRAGVVWHTQGSGKSLTMAFYAGRVVWHPAMENPTIVVITDRNDLDDQLFGTFSRCRELLRQQPVQAASRADLREKLKVASGGVVFTTVQKFFPFGDEQRHPQLSDRRNIVVIADEAHRSQYDFIDGFARHMREALPNASFIGFTGTPIELADANTRQVFGEYVSIYDIQRAVKDGATVPIYYESRLAKLKLDEKARPKLDSDFEEATEGEEIEHKEKLKTKWAQLEALVGAEPRIKLIAQDLVNHFEKRLAAMDGKAMIVCMSRRICVDLYKAIVAIRPDWHHGDDDKGTIKIVMTGDATDPLDWQPHIRSKARREALAKSFKDPKEPFKVVIVRDMWLTGFDAPCLHTMYVDKPMRGHGLMQAIARVNRVFRDKPGGLVVDYLGLADELRKALANYTESGGKGQTAIDVEQAVVEMLKRYEVCRDIFHGFDWSAWRGGPRQRLSILPAAQEHVLGQHDGKARFVAAAGELSKAFALAVPHDRAMAIQDDVWFFQAVKVSLLKGAAVDRRSPEDIDLAIRQIVSQAVASDEVLDIFTAAGLRRPDISILSDEFLAEVRGMPHRNLAVEMLRKLLEGEIKTRGRKNIVQARSFAEMLEKSLVKYQNRAIETAQVIEELIALAKEMREAGQRGESLGLNDDEVAFYDALEVNDSAVKVLGDATLRIIAQELLRAVRGSVAIDWTVRENVRAQMRVLIKRILRRYGYPPDKQARATELVLEQAEVLCKDWTGNGAGGG